MSEEQGLSKKELRAQKRAEKQARKQEEEIRVKKESFTQNIFTWGLVAVIGIALVLFVGNLRPDDASLSEGAQDVAVTESDWIAGNPEAPVTLVEYGDFMCPACGVAHPVVGDILEKHGENMRFVFRNFPFLSPKSHTAARAVEAAGEQGKFYEMYDLIFENQGEVSRAVGVEEIFAGYAEELGLDLEAYNTAFESKEVADRVSESVRNARNLGVNSTPTFFLNGQRVNVASFNQIEDLVVTAIEEAASSAEPVEAEGEENGENLE